MSDDSRYEVKALIGVVMAITGNFLISLALNVQKYAHNQIKRQAIEFTEYSAPASVSEPTRLAPQSSSPYYPPSPAPGHSHVTIPTSPEALGSSGHNSLSATDSTARHDENAYLKSRSWWLGMVLMVSGEVGNFMAYGFAPASVVAPLGTVTLITNVFLAPLVLKETVRTRDAIGVVLAILGAMVVVSSSKSTEVSLTPESLWAAITSFTAGLYYLLTVTTMVILAVLSPVWGPRLVLIDIGLVALSGGYTVLATKGVSSLLQLELILMFKHPITYLLLAVLLYSAVVQIRYLNRALQYFDSTVVIPTQFVLFTLSAIIGSAVIYRDFEDVSLRAGFFFVLGCLLTFLGVFLITSNRP
ncbi:magnesium transporter NIPA-domain-containing protein, partial [Dimargaris cristalligena]